MAYRHPPADTGLRNLHNAMELNAIGQPVIRVTSSTASSSESATTDGFGRQRVSQPFTLFDAQLRYTQRDDLFVSEFAGSGSGTYTTAESALSLNVSTGAGDRHTRESKRVFAYQPGKSFQVFTTFVMSVGETGLAQRVGLFNDENGIFFANIDGVNCIVKRSSSSGSLVETVIPQSEWNVDRIDGTTVSGIDIDITKAQIFFIDLEWLGVGEVRTGFVIDGAFYFAHVFSHANNSETTYMTTACLPIRYEIENTGVTTQTNSLKQICATVISEGGYALRGRKHTASIPIISPRALDNNQAWPLMSVRLRTGSLDAIALLQGLSVSFSAAGNYSIKIVEGGTLTGDVFNPVGSGSHVEYDVSASAISGADELQTTVLSLSNQSTATLSLDGNLFGYQFERDGLAGEAITYTIVVEGDPNSFDATAALNWEEVF